MKQPLDADEQGRRTGTHAVHSLSSVLLVGAALVMLVPARLVNR